MPGLRRSADRATWQAPLLPMPDDLRDVLRRGKGLSPPIQKGTYVMFHASLVAVLLSLELVSQTPAKTSSAWVAVESKEGGFSVSLPGKPIEQTMELPSPVGKLKAKMFICLFQDCALIVQQISLPVAVPASNIATELEAAKKAAAPNLPKLVSEKRIKVGDVPGIELVHSGPTKPDNRNRTMKIHIFIAGTNSCSLIAVSGPDKPLPAEADRFLDSLRFGGSTSAASKPEMAAKPAAPPAKRKALAKIDLLDKTPEDAMRTFMMAMAAADEKTLRAVTLPNNELDLLLTGEAPPFAGVKEMKQQMQKMKIERLKEGDRVKMPGNKVHVVRVTEVGRDRAALLPEDAPFPTRLRLVSGHWKVDASPVIAAHKAASSARWKAGTN